MALKRRQVRIQFEDAELNVVSLMDIMTTMLFFLIIFASFGEFSVLKSSALSRGTPSQQPKATFTLKVTLDKENSAQVFLGPTKGLTMASGYSDARLSRILPGSGDKGFKRTVRGADAQAFARELQKVLIEIKKAFPLETKAVLAIKDDIPYQFLIDGLAAVRSLPVEAEGFEVRNIVGPIQKTKVLFPEVILSEEMGAK